MRSKDRRGVSVCAIAKLAGFIRGFESTNDLFFKEHVNDDRETIAALILVGRLGAAEPTIGNPWELDAIAAAAIGGASSIGGNGRMVGTLIGAIILGALRNGLKLMNVQVFYQLLATGIIIVVVMLIDWAARGR